MRNKNDCTRSALERLLGTDDLKGRFGTDDPVEILASFDPEAFVGTTPDGAIEGFEEDAEELRTLVLAAKKEKTRLDELRARHSLEYLAAKLGKTHRQVTEYCNLGLVPGAYHTPGGQWRVKYQDDTVEKVKANIAEFSRNRSKCPITALVEEKIKPPPGLIPEESMLEEGSREPLNVQEYEVSGASVILVKKRKKKITQTEVSKMTGISRTTLRKKKYKLKLGDAVAAVGEGNGLFEQYTNQINRRNGKVRKARPGRHQKPEGEGKPNQDNPEESSPEQNVPNQASGEPSVEASPWEESEEELMTLWDVNAAANKWPAALDIAETLVEVARDDPPGWLRRSHALHKMGRTAEARDKLLPAAAKFPGVGEVSYDLARYDCKLGRLEQAKAWLQKAFKGGDARALKSTALREPDLQPLRNEIERI